MAPRTQLGAPSIVNTVLRGRDINRTYVQGHGEGDECFPKVEIKVINDILLSLVVSHGALQLKEPERAEKKLKGPFAGDESACLLGLAGRASDGARAEPCEVRAHWSGLL